MQMRFPILPDAGPEADDHATLRYDRATKRWVPGPVVDAAEVAAMQSTLDDYQAGQDATDTAVASVLATEEGQARSVLTGVVGGALDGMPFAPSTGVTLAAAGTDPVPVESIGGYLYAAAGSTLYRSQAEGGPWQEVHAFGSGGAINGLREAGDGEVVMSRTQDGIWRSTGWATDPLTATWTQTLVTNAQVTPFSWDVDPGSGWVSVTCYVAGSDMSLSRYVWLSQDHGANFTQIFDMAAEHPGLAMATSHMHHASLDPLWNSTTPRIWVSYHKTPDDPTEATDKLQRTIYSDDAGATWTVFSSETDSSHHPVIAISTPAGMVFDTDTSPTGLFLVPRTTNPADMTASTRRALYIIRRGIPMTGWAARAIRGSTGAVHVAFRSSVAGYPGSVVSTDGYRAQETLIVPAATAGDTVDFLNLTLHRGRLLGVARQTLTDPTGRVVIAADEPARGAPPRVENGLDTGSAGPLAVAGGEGAVAPLDKSVALGVEASTTQPRGTALGYRANAGDADATALGQSATTTKQLGTAIGSGSSATDGLSVGGSTSSVDNGTALGRSAQATGTDATAVGSTAKATGANSTAVGQNAQATGQWSVALGRGAVASETSSMAFGRGANASHASSVAVGTAATTTANSQVNIGGREVEMTSKASPAVPAAGAVRLAARTVSGAVELVARFPSGAITVIGGEIAYVRTPIFVTASRPDPAAVGKGAHIFDSTLNKPIWSNGTAWVDATGAAV